MSDPRREAISWKDLPRERQRWLVVLIGKLIRQRLAVPPNAAEAANEPDDRKRTELLAHAKASQRRDRLSAMIALVTLAVTLRPAIGATRVDLARLLRED